MKRFLEDDFLLDSKVAVDLYEKFARRQPIIDYHCHLSPHQVADDYKWRSITEIWLQGDHYKWRAMRTNGVPERNITGDASDWDKFAAWAATVPHTLRNPLFHWTHLELKFPFGVSGKLLGPDTAKEIYEHCNRKLAEPAFTAQGLLAQYDVKVVCSTDDPVDDLEPHRRHAKNAAARTKLCPTWRPDKALALHDPVGWNEWVDKLSAAADVDVRNLASLREALQKRHDFFHATGCRASDHGLERIFAAPYTEAEVAEAFAAARARKSVSPEQIEKLRSALCYDFAVMDHKRGWVQQFHLGAMRNNSTRAMRVLGPDTGYDSIGDFPQGEALVRFFDRLDAEGQLAKTIVYNLNPGDNELLTTIIGSFQDGSVPGKMQFGSAWWFLDQLDGMTQQMNALSNMGLLARFVGMLTDSRSFLSYSRHDYFRRLLCNLLGTDVVAGRLPNDEGLLGPLVANVCYGNARGYFGFEI
jgi:glucuronate isomerase